MVNVEYVWEFGLHNHLINSLYCGKLSHSIDHNKNNLCFYSLLGKQRRLKQAKEEAQDEIEKYRAERERQFKEFEAKVIT